MKKWLIMFLLGIMALSQPSQAADYVVGEGDVLDIFVWGVKELNVSVKVRPDGKITIPGIGDVKASGFTPPGLQKLLTEKLKELVKNPNVTVTVRDITNSKVYIFGGGVKSVAYDLNRSTTLLQLLCNVGDVRSADLKRAYVLRNGKKIKADFHKLFINGEISEDMVIESSDSIYIPLLLDKSVYVLGAVNNPKFIEYRDGMTVMQAILEAGGFSKFAKQNDTTILRNEGGKEVIIQVKAKDILNDGDLSQNFKLKPNDYVLVKEGMF
ncbi:MAG: polysaccharide biosynthesis/export family protein [Deltaproteobacteria bacterium]|jgi:polysaccharide export outer membrane protein|nr:polysaccharide biosynthesis/export family protein [Deltaproteobacteria bacterium]